MLMMCLTADCTYKHAVATGPSQETKEGTVRVGQVETVAAEAHHQHQPELPSMAGDWQRENTSEVWPTLVLDTAAALLHHVCSGIFARHG